MSIVDLALDRAAAITASTSDRLNPILIKETRQATQSKLFSTVFLMFVAFSWIVLVFGTLSQWEYLETQPTAEAFFAWNFSLLSFAILVIVPFGSYRSLLAEQELHTYDLLRITALSPRQIVRGKLGTSLLQIIVYYSAIAPFIAFTSVLQGFDVAWISWVLLMSFLWSMALCTGALLTGISSRQNQWQSANMVGLIVMLLIGWGFVLSFVLAGRSAVDFEEPDFWWVNGVGLLAAVSYVILAGQVIVARLTFASGNRSTGIRIVLTVQFWLAVGVLGLLVWLGNSHVLDSDFQINVGCVVLLHWAGAGLFLATESDFLSRRIRLRLPGSRWLRFLAAPFLPGGGTGTVLVFAHVILIGLGLLVAGVLLGGDPTYARRIETLAIILLNVIIWVGIASALARWCRKLSYRFTPAAVRILTFTLFVVVQILSVLPSMLDADMARDLIWMSALSPFLMITIVSSVHGGYSGFDASYNSYQIVWGIVITTAVLVVVINLPAMFASVSRIVRDPGPADFQATPPPPEEPIGA